ncbi:MAG: SH3 domain-containing protein [Anaerolineae bacterium]|nr:SH3 domain-containing protein [Anaerolineae bacterium]
MDAKVGATMKFRPLRNTILLTLMLAMLLWIAACGGSPAATRTLAPTATQPQPGVQPTSLPPPALPTALLPTTSPATATIPPTHTAIPPATATASPTATATSAPSATPTIAPTQRPSATPTPAPHAIVTSETLNVRSGPDTQFEAVTRLARGDALTVVGQSDGCAWLKVLTAQGLLGWVARQSGGTELVKLTLPCAEIPEFSVPTPTARPRPPTHTPQPTPTARPLPPTQPPEARPQPTVPPPPLPPPPVRQPAPKQPPPPPQPGAPADRGCYLFQNSMGAELNVMLSGSSGWQDSFKIRANGEHVSCMAPESYNYTIDAPAPWAAIGGSLVVRAGSHIRFPLQGAVMKGLAQFRS